MEDHSWQKELERDSSARFQSVERNKLLISVLMQSEKTCEGAGPHLGILTLKHEDGGGVFFPVLDGYREQWGKHSRVKQSFYLHNVAERHRLQLHLRKHEMGL